MAVERKGNRYSPPDPSIPPEETRVCFCHGVSEAELRLAIRAGAKTHEAIQAETCASTGCTGCTDDVLAILADEIQGN